MKIKVRYFGYIIISIFLILTTNTVYFVNSSSKFSVLTSAVLLLTLFFSVPYFLKKNKIMNYQALFLVIYFFIAFLYQIINNNGSLNSINVYLCYIPGLFIYWSFFSEERKEEFLKVLIFISTVLAIFSMVCWLFIVQLEILKTTGFAFISWGEKSSAPTFYNVFFLPQQQRNCAIFVEGPVCNFFFSTVLLLNEFRVHYKRKNIVNFILILMLATAQTTTGYMVIAFFMFYKASRITSKNVFRIILKSIVVIAGICVVILYIKNLMSFKMETKSAEVRSIRMDMEFSAFLEKPFLGWGYGSYTYGSSNSITSLLADGGIIMWGIFYLPLIGNILYDLIALRRINYSILIYIFYFAISAFHYSFLSAFVVAVMWDSLLKRLFTNSKIKEYEVRSPEEEFIRSLI